MTLANKKMRARIELIFKDAIANGEHVSEEFKAAAAEWLEVKDDAAGSKAAAAKLKPMIAAGKAAGCPVCKQLDELAHYLTKRSQWIIGGDGAAYDIGYGVSTTVIAFCERRKRFGARHRSLL